MLGKIGALGGLLGPKIDHPLADAKELRRIIAELPVGNAFKTLDEVSGWLESLENAADFPPDLLLQIVTQLDDAAQPHLRRLGRDYLQATRMSRAEENRLWTIVRSLWSRLAWSYELCLKAAAKGKLSDSFKASLPLLCGRLIAALGVCYKWDCFHYASASPALWGRLGYALRVAEEVGQANRPVQLYAQFGGPTTVVQEYLKVLVFQASSMDSLLPLEMELAERLIAHYLPDFVFGPEGRPDSVYWVDLASGQPPMRLARMPKELAPTLRFFQPGAAHAQLESLTKTMAAGHDLPKEINLGGQYSARVLLPVIRHLGSLLAPVPPQRQHRRHPVKHRMAVVGGLAHALAVFAQGATELRMESWVVEDVSLGGFGTAVKGPLPEWLKIGALLALQPEGGENWLLGIVRRCYRDGDGEMRVGVESLAKQVAPVQLKPRNAAGQVVGSSLACLQIQEGNESGEMRFVLPPASFDSRESLEFDQDGKRVLLTPVVLLERSADYEVARYRALVAE
ncbi:MAG TPA: hypothetical protein VFF03_11165 [Rhodocyclaceae bacterium]|nr:hypothetical protein [Rhodocyclaceae bacterium]